MIHEGGRKGGDRRGGKSGGKGAGGKGAYQIEWVDAGVYDSSLAGMLAPKPGTFTRNRDAFMDAPRTPGRSDRLARLRESGSTIFVGTNKVAFSGSQMQSELMLR